MKKYIILFTCILFIFMASCGNPADTDTNANANPPADNNAAESNKDNAGAASSENIYGAISEIIGNLTTINIAVIPETGIPVPMDRRAFDLDNIDRDKLPEGVEINDDGSISINGSEIKMGDGAIFSGELPEGFDASSMDERIMNWGDSGDGQTRMFSGDGNGGFARNMGEDGFSSMRGAMGSMLLDYTGEEKEFIIPVGQPIYALSRDDDGNETETEIELSNIQAGNVISVRYKEDGKTIDKIIISQITAMSPSEAEEMKERMESFTNYNGDNINNIDSDNNDAEESGE